MQRTSFGDMPCPIARSLERVGEWWSILILRDALYGMTRFEQFQRSLRIAPNMLTRRLGALVESGLLERRLYQERPPRHEYVLTERGRDFRPVILALLTWGNKHFAPEGASVIIAHMETGIPADPMLVDRRTGLPLTQPPYRVVAGPAATDRLRRRYAASADAPNAPNAPNAPGALPRAIVERATATPAKAGNASKTVKTGRPAGASAPPAGRKKGGLAS